MKRLPFTRPKNTTKVKSAKIRKQLPEGTPTATQLIAELMIVFGAITLCVGAFLWWHYIVSNPKRVFWGMMSSSLQTPSTTIRTQQSDESQTVDQVVRLNVNAQHVASGRTVLSQTGTTSSVTTETIGTPHGDYIRYLAVNTTQKGANGQPLNFSKLLNVWGKTPTDASETNGDSYNQAVLGLIPYGNLNQAQRQELMKFMEQAYSFNDKEVRKYILNGRPVYDYNIEVKPKAYVIMLKRFGSMTGLTQLEQIDPNNYESATPIGFVLTVDVWSRQATSIRYPKSDRIEKISGWGIVSPPVVLPKDAIGVDELQSRLQTLQ
jgi:hypothetical protein